MRLKGEQLEAVAEVLRSAAELGEEVDVYGALARHTGPVTMYVWEGDKLLEEVVIGPRGGLS